MGCLRCRHVYTCTLLQLYSVAVIDVSNNLCAEVFLSLQTRDRGLCSSVRKIL